MCNFFSFAVTKDGKILALLGEERKEVYEQGKHPDSHSVICDYYGVSEDECWKFDLDLTPEKWGQLVSGKAKLAQVVERAYDGGLPYEDFPFEYLVKVVKWLQEEAIPEIEKLGCIYFGGKLIQEKVFAKENWNTQFKSILWELPKEVTFQELIDQLDIEPTRRGWGHYIKYVDDERNHIRMTLRKPQLESEPYFRYIACQYWIHEWKEYNPETAKVEERREYRMSIVPVYIPVKIIK